MSRIQGEDHKELAALLDYRVTKLEERVEDAIDKAVDNGRAIAGIDAKVDVLLAQQRSQTTTQQTTATPIWQNASWLRSVALVIAAFAGWAFALGRDLSAHVFDWLTKHFGGN